MVRSGNKTMGSRSHHLGPHLSAANWASTSACQHPLIRTKEVVSLHRKGWAMSSRIAMADWCCVAYLQLRTVITLITLLYKKHDNGVWHWAEPVKPPLQCWISIWVPVQVTAALLPSKLPANTPRRALGPLNPNGKCQVPDFCLAQPWPLQPSGE